MTESSPLQTQKGKALSDGPLATVIEAIRRQQAEKGGSSPFPSRRAFENRTKLTEMRLLAVTRKLYAKEYGA